MKDSRRIQVEWITIMYIGRQRGFDLTCDTY